MKNDNELNQMTLADASRGLESGRFSSVQLVTACLEQIDALGPRLNCFVEVASSKALEQAKIADAQIQSGQRKGPIHGIPLAHKDMFFRSGNASSMGSKLGSRFIPKTTATILERLDAAGAISVGTLHMTEFAAGPTGQNEYLGSCRNPWNLAHISGGSSSGSGCAVAARLVFGSTASDGGGSIRLPAGMCGVVGVKPTYGSVSRHGAMPRSWSLDAIGPIARTALDCALLLEVMAGPDSTDPATWAQNQIVTASKLGASITGIKIGLPRNQFLSNATAEV